MLCCPYVATVAVVAVAIGTQVKYKLDGTSDHVWCPTVLSYHMKIFHGSLVLECSV